MHDSAAVTGSLGNETRNDSEAHLSVLDLEILANLRDLPGEGDDGLLGELIDLFAQDAPARLVLLRAAVLQGDAKQVTQIAHSLKGSSANLGATYMAGLCNDLEQRARGGSLDGGMELHAQLELEYRRVVRALEVERRRPVQ
jgi:HPt (histidine-containing phosphotransfer) domain-containing protein